jgi:hypothetical protein
MELRKVGGNFRLNLCPRWVYRGQPNRVWRAQGSRVQLQIVLRDDSSSVRRCLMRRTMDAGMSLGNPTGKLWVTLSIELGAMSPSSLSCSITTLPGTPALFFRHVFRS